MRRDGQHLLPIVCLMLSRGLNAFLTPLSRSRQHIAARNIKTHRSHLPSSDRNTIATTRLFSTQLSEDEKVELTAAIQSKGDEIRQLKENGASKSEISPLVDELLALKIKLDPTSVKPPQKKQQKKQQPKKQQQQKPQSQESESDYITPRNENFSKWYSDVIRLADLAETSPVRGCMIIKPWGMSLWDAVRTDLDERIRRHGAQNAYFPLLIPQSFLSKEAEHVDGFAKECAVVTHHRLAAREDGTLGPDPAAQLEEPYIIRPTSETIIWNSFAKWIGSHRDLPLKVNQWANVMRWEMRTRPFLRTSEFLWQEGHTAHATAEGAEEDAKAMLVQYAALARDVLAIPVVEGVKSPSERFAGAEETYTIEALMPNGWALQSGTSHFLGRSFGKAFDVTFQNEAEEREVVWGTSWGVSTRLIGALIMTHSDDSGLVVPPRVAPVQVVIVPITPKKDDEEGAAALKQSLDALTSDLEARGLRVKVDDRDYVRNGAKYFEWERKGVPLRIELGPRDVKQNVCIFKYRSVVEEKTTVNLADAGEEAVKGLDDLQSKLYQVAKERLENGITRGTSYQEMKEALEGDEAGSFPGAGLYLVPWKCDAENEDKIKEECKATIRCYPLEENGEGAVEGKKCFYSGEPATHMALFGRAF